jgi:hypothetical protein
MLKDIIVRKLNKISKDSLIVIIASVLAVACFAPAFVPVPHDEGDIDIKKINSVYFIHTSLGATAASFPLLFDNILDFRITKEVSLAATQLLLLLSIIIPCAVVYTASVTGNISFGELNITFLYIIYNTTNNFYIVLYSSI